jgi:hypothetical protein
MKNINWLVVLLIFVWLVAGAVAIWAPNCKPDEVLGAAAVVTVLSFFFVAP